MYLKPARERAEALDRERKGLPPKPKEGEKPASSGPPHRAIMVGIFMQLGMTNEQANAEYDRQLKLEQEKRNGRHS